MTLRYWDLEMDYDWYSKVDNKRRYEFQCNMGFISSYISKRIRRLKFDTDGKFNSFDIILLPSEQIKVKSLFRNFRDEHTLCTYLAFDEVRYNQVKDTDDYSYYMLLLRQGISQASQFVSLPVNEMNDILNDFESNGFLNEWIHKKKLFRELGLQVILKCEYTRKYFQVRLIAKMRGNPSYSVEGIVMRTEPDYVVFYWMYKDIEQRGDKIIVTTRSDACCYYIDVEDLKKGIFTVGIKGRRFFIESVEDVAYKEMVVVREGIFFH